MFRDRERDGEVIEPVHRIVIALPQSVLTELDRLAFAQRQDHRQRRGPNRDAIIRTAVREYLQRQADARLAGRP